MAVVSQVSTLRFDDGLGNFRQWRATADAQDKTAGSAFSITIAQTSGGTPPGVANTLTLNIYKDNNTLFTTTTLTAGSSSQSVSVTPTVAGTFSIDIRATRTDVGTYDYETDGSPSTAPTGFATTADRGWFRTTTSVSQTLNRETEYAYGDAITVAHTFGAAPSVSRNVTVSFGPVSSTIGSGTSTSLGVSLGNCDNRFSTTPASQTTGITFANSPLSNMPWTTATVTTDSAIPDPRLTTTGHIQVNDNMFGAPPTSKAAPGSKRLTSDLGFISVRYTNARGEGINNLTYDGKLWDSQELIGSEASPVKSRTGLVTQNQGGEAGWGPSFLVWDNSLPSGQWMGKTSVTAPSSATNLDGDPISTFSLVASNPNLRIITGAGPTDDKKHFVPGSPFLTLVGGFNTTTGKRVAIDVGTAKVALIRLMLATEKAQYLASDGTTWVDVDDNATVHYHDMTSLAGDAKIFKKVFTDTSGWGTSDIVVIGRGEIGGVPINSFDKEINVFAINNHDAYKFDGAGFLGFPTR